MGLLVGLGIHEVEIVAVAIEKLHINFIDDDLVDWVGRAKTVLEHRAGAQVAQLGLDKRAQIARSTVLNAEHRVQIIVVLDDHARTQLCGWNRHAKNLLSGKCLPRRAGSRWQSERQAPSPVRFGIARQTQ